MRHTENTFPAPGGLSLFYQSWQPDAAPRAALILVHGMGDHSGRFGRLVEPLVASGFAVYGFDLRGFGRSPGRKGHIDSLADYREDLRAFLRLVHQQTPGAPVFLLGYSLGAGIALDFVLRDPADLRGAVFIGAPIDPAGVGSPFQRVLARALSRVWPTFTVPMSNNPNPVTRDPAVRTAILRDPYHHNLVTARWGAESMALVDWLQARAAEIRLPVLFLHGGADPINTLRGVQRFYDGIAYPDKTLKVYPGSLHEVHNDLDHAQAAADLVEWMEKHC